MRYIADAYYFCVTLMQPRLNMKKVWSVRNVYFINLKKHRYHFVNDLHIFLALYVLRVVCDFSFLNISVGCIFYIKQ